MHCFKGKFMRKIKNLRHNLSKLPQTASFVWVSAIIAISLLAVATEGNYMILIPTVIIICFVGIRIVKHKTKQANDFAQMINDVAAGKTLKLDLESEDTPPPEEGNNLEKAIYLFKKNMIKQSTVLGDMQGYTDSQDKKRSLLVKLASSFEDIVLVSANAVTNHTETVQNAARDMATAAYNTNEYSTTVAKAINQSSENINTVASAAEQLSSSIKSITEQIHESSRISNEAVEEVKNSDKTVKELENSTNEIGNITELINNIAGQINMLALNATIEAARAGEAGKGFAVVAAEVKDLASQTTNATQEISSKISSIQAVVQDTVKAMTEIGSTISKINAISSTISESVESQNLATLEISKNIQETASNTQEISQNIVKVSDQASSVNEFSNSILNISGETETEAKGLRKKVIESIQDIRASG